MIRRSFDPQHLTSATLSYRPVLGRLGFAAVDELAGGRRRGPRPAQHARHVLCKADEVDEWRVKKKG